MATEIPMYLINQLQISLRKEARLSFYDPGDTSLPSLPSAEEAISELDLSTPYIRCRHCKGKLLRGIESLICVFCGKQQRTSDNPPGPVKFTSTSGYRWLLSSLNLDGSEIVESSKEVSGLNRRRNAPVEEIPLSSFLDLEIKWRAEEKLTTSNSDEKSVKSKVSLKLGGLDLDDFFIEGRGSAAKVKQAQNNPVKNTVNDDFKDPRSLSLFENVESTGSSVLQQRENLSLFEEKDAQEGFPSKEHENLSLFEGKHAQESVSSEEHKNLGLFEGKDAPESNSSEEKEKVGLFESIPPSEAAEKSTEDKIGDSASNWEIDVQSADKQNILEEPKSGDPFVVSSVDLSVHMDTVFGSGKDLSDGKLKDSSAASGSNAGNCCQDDLFSNISNQAQLNYMTVYDNDAGKMEYGNETSSMNIDWIQDDLWQTITKKPSDNKTTDDIGDDWNDFSSLTNAESPSSSCKQSGVETFDGTTNIENEGRAEVGKSPPNVDWIQDDKWQIGTSTVSDETKNQDDFFGAWNDFTGSTVSQVPSTSSVQQSAVHIKPYVEQTSETNLFDVANNQEGFDIGGFSQLDFFSGGFSNQNNSAEVKVVQSEASTSDRACDPAGKVQMTKDVTLTNDLFNTTAKSKTDNVETLMAQMHDLTFMLGSMLSVPSNPKEEEFSSFSKD